MQETAGIQLKSRATDIFAETPKLQLNEEKESKEKTEAKPKAEQQNNTEIIITFGKYKGQSLTDIYHNDRSYIKYLRDKSKDTEIIKECEKLLAS